MRKVTEKAAKALQQMHKMTSGNTRVSIEERFAGDKPVKMAVMYLHDNQIAMYDGKLLTLTDAGWHTPTTKDRLNGVLTVFNIPCSINQHNYQWYMYDDLDVERHTWTSKMTVVVGV